MTAALRPAARRPAVRTLSIPARTAHVEAASLQVARALAVVVREVSELGHTPLIFAGSCDVAPGVLAGLADPDCGVVWIDAHPDFNTPGSSRSGFWPGMTLAVVVGDCGEHVRTTLSLDAVPQARVALIGVRSLSPAAEARRLRASQLDVVRWRHGRPQHSVADALDRLARRVDRVYVHLDLDALDPSIGRGIVDTPVPGGLTASQLIDVLVGVRRRLAIAATTIATYVPVKDDGKTVASAITAAHVLHDEQR